MSSGPSVKGVKVYYTKKLFVVIETVEYIIKEEKHKKI